MSHTFDSAGFEAIAADAKRLAARAEEHERRLSSLVDALESDPANKFVGVVRELCVEARTQRLTADAIRASLMGDVGFTNGHRTRRPLVIIVDDAADNRDMAAMLLDTAGFDTITAANGLEGVIVAHYAQPAVIIMDMAMPVLDGVQAARLLKASQRTHAIPVIAYTARPQSEDPPLKGMFDGLLRKPSSPEEMVDLVQRLAVPGDPDVA